MIIEPGVEPIALVNSWLSLPTVIRIAWIVGNIKGTCACLFYFPFQWKSYHFSINNLLILLVTLENTDETKKKRVMIQNPLINPEMMSVKMLTCSLLSCIFYAYTHIYCYCCFSHCFKNNRLIIISHFIFKLTHNNCKYG